MSENRISLNGFAMQFGTYMGVFWMVKFVFFPLGLSHSFLMFFFVALTLAVPFVGYYYGRVFRDRICGGGMTFMQAWAFLIFMYLYAALFTAVAHYIYFRFIDNGLILDTYTATLNQARETVPGFAELWSQYPVEEMLEQARNLTPIKITIQLLTNNMLYCSILALITAPFVARRRKPVA